MLAKVNSCAVIGLDGELVEVEVDISGGLPAFKDGALTLLALTARAWYARRRWGR